jgi:hypothetical protein
MQQFLLVVLLVLPDLGDLAVKLAQILELLVNLQLEELLTVVVTVQEEGL